MSAFIKVSTAVFDDKELSCHAIAVYVALCRFADASDRSKPVWPSTPTLSEKTRMSRTMVKKGLKELVNKQIIRRESRYKESSLTYILK
jgi:predicted transcriptional regulator